jgi:hypothetical protein
VASGVVHSLQTVDIDEAEDQTRLRAPAPIDLVLQCRKAPAPTECPSQVVDAGCVEVEARLMA